MEQLSAVGERPALYTSKMIQLEMQENMTSFTDQILGMERGSGEIASAHLYILAFAKRWQLPDY